MFMLHLTVCKSISPLTYFRRVVTRSFEPVNVSRLISRRPRHFITLIFLDVFWQRSTVVTYFWVVSRWCTINRRAPACMLPICMLIYWSNLGLLSFNPQLHNSDATWTNRELVNCALWSEYMMPTINCSIMTWIQQETETRYRRLNINRTPSTHVLLCYWESLKKMWNRFNSRMHEACLDNRYPPRKLYCTSAPRVALCALSVDN